MVLAVCCGHEFFFWLFVAMWFFHPCLRELVPFPCLYMYIYSVTCWFFSFVSLIYIFFTFDQKKRKEIELDATDLILTVIFPLLDWMFLLELLLLLCHAFTVACRDLCVVLD